MGMAAQTQKRGELEAPRGKSRRGSGSSRAGRAEGAVVDRFGNPHPHPHPHPRPRARSCVGCGERVDGTAVRGRNAELVRLILGPGSEVAVDAGSGGFGRGAYVHPRPDCLAKAVQKGLPKAVRGKVTLLRAVDVGSDVERAELTVEALAEAVRDAMTRRIHGLFASAARSGSLALGADAVTGACERGEAALVVVACDAAAGADLPEVRRAVAEGRAVAWGTKQTLAAMCVGGRAGGSARTQEAELAVVAVTSRASIAEALRDAVRAADACSSVEAGAGAGAGAGKSAGDAAGKAAGRGGKTKIRSGSAAGAAANRRADG
jgi:predicted RNA-binding protein YlxR (DUF448 family)